MLICGAWVYWAAETTTAINIALIYAASPVLITLGAVIGLKESFSWKQSLGVGIALLGVLHVVVQGQWAALSHVIWVLGDGLVVIAMMAWAAYALLLKKWSSPLSSTARLAATCLGGRSESVGRITSGHCWKKVIQRNSRLSRSVRAAT